MLKKFISYFFLIAIFAAKSAVAQTQPSKLYFYKLDIQNANELVNGYIEPDLVSTQIASGVTASQPDACIDLRKQMTLTYRAERGILYSGVFAILLNTEITDSTKSAIVARVCQNAPSSGTCSVRFNEEIYEYTDLSISNQPPVVVNQFQPEPTYHPLSGRPSLPRFSSACESGQYEDSWEFAAETREARSYLSNLGVTIVPLGVLGLTKADGTKIFEFGHPRSR